MTVATTPPEARFPYVGPKDYDFDFRVFEGLDVVVYYTNILGVTRTLVLNSEYTVTVTGDTGGICHLTLTETDGYIDIRRIMPLVQSTDYVNNNAFDMEILEMDFDKVMMILQQMDVIARIGFGTTNWLGDWQPLTSYTLKDLIKAPSGNVYTCVLEHTSSNDFNADLSSGTWSLVIDVDTLQAASAAAVAAAASATQDSANASTDAASARSDRIASNINAANAQGSAQLALTHASNAKASEQLSEYAKIEAYHWANYPEDSQVPESRHPPEYSAYHWMKKASLIAGGGVVSISGAHPVTIDNTDPNNPIISVTGVPAGGTIGQMLVKSGNTDYDYHWVDPPEAKGRIDKRSVSGPINANVQDFECFDFHITGNTIITLHGFTDAYHKTVVMTLRGAGTQVTFSNVRWPGGVAPELSTGEDRLVFSSGAGADKAFGGVAGIGYA